MSLPYTSLRLGAFMIDYLKYRKGELLVPLVMFGYATYYYIEVRGLPKPETNLLLIGPIYWMMAIAVISYFIVSYLKFARANKPQKQEKSDLEVTDRKATVAFLGLTCAYVFCIAWMGFVFSSWLYMLLLLVAFSVTRKTVLLFLPLLTALFIYATFDLWLGIPLPKGWLL